MVGVRGAADRRTGPADLPSPPHRHPMAGVCITFWYSRFVFTFHALVIDLMPVGCFGLCESAVPRAVTRICRKQIEVGIWACNHIQIWRWAARTRVTLCYVAGFGSISDTTSIGTALADTASAPLAHHPKRAPPAPPSPPASPTPFKPRPPRTRTIRTSTTAVATTVTAATTVAAATTAAKISRASWVKVVGAVLSLERRGGGTVAAVFLFFWEGGWGGCGGRTFHGGGGGGTAAVLVFSLCSGAKGRWAVAVVFLGGGSMTMAVVAGFSWRGWRRIFCGGGGGGGVFFGRARGGTVVAAVPFLGGGGGWLERLAMAERGTGVGVFVVWGGGRDGGGGGVSRAGGRVGRWRRRRGFFCIGRRLPWRLRRWRLHQWRADVGVGRRRRCEARARKIWKNK